MFGRPPREAVRGRHADIDRFIDYDRLAFDDSASERFLLTSTDKMYTMDQLLAERDPFLAELAERDLTSLL